MLVKSNADHVFSSFERFVGKFAQDCGIINRLYPLFSIASNVKSEVISHHQTPHGGKNWTHSRH